MSTTDSDDSSVSEEQYKSETTIKRRKNKTNNGRRKISRVDCEPLNQPEECPMCVAEINSAILASILEVQSDLAANSTTTI